MSFPHDFLQRALTIKPQMDQIKMNNLYSSESRFKLFVAHMILQFVKNSPLPLIPDFIHPGESIFEGME